MKKIEILTPPGISKSNQGYAIYIEGKKVWESTKNFPSVSEEINVDDLLYALGFKLHVVELTDKILEDNYGIFPDNLDEFSQQISEENDAIEDEIEEDSMFYDSDLTEIEAINYDHNYDLIELEQMEDIDWDKDFFNEEDFDNWD